MFVFILLPTLLNCSNDQNNDENVPNPVDRPEQADVPDQAEGIQPPQQNPNVEEQQGAAAPIYEGPLNETDRLVMTDQPVQIIHLLHFLSDFLSRSCTLPNMSESLKVKLSESAILERLFSILFNRLGSLQECVSSLDFTSLGGQFTMPRIAQTGPVQENLEVLLFLIRQSRRRNFWFVLQNFFTSGFESFVLSVLEEFFDFTDTEDENLKNEAQKFKNATVTMFNNLFLAYFHKMIELLKRLSVSTVEYPNLYWMEWSTNQMVVHSFWMEFMIVLRDIRERIQSPENDPETASIQNQILEQAHSFGVENLTIHRTTTNQEYEDHLHQWEVRSTGLPQYQVLFDILLRLWEDIYTHNEPREAE